MSDRLATALTWYGVSKGDRVFVLLPNSVEAVVGILACLKAGAVFVLPAYATRQERLDYILADCRPRAVITDNKAVARVAAASLVVDSENPKLIVVGEQQECGRDVGYEWIQRQCPAVRPPVHCFDSDLACIIYTSGSTATPKGVMCEHGNMEFAARTVIRYLENTEADVILNVLPLSFSYGLYQALMAFMSGATLVLEQTFAYPALLLQRMETERVTGLPAVPTMLVPLLQFD